MYAMQAVAAFGSASEDTAAIVIEAETGDLIVGHVHAASSDRSAHRGPADPLVRHVPGGGFLEGRIEVPLPLAETSPYFPDLTLRRYEIVNTRA